MYDLNPPNELFHVPSKKKPWDEQYESLGVKKQVFIFHNSFSRARRQQKVEAGIR